ncbi:MAG: hypothetical protein IJS89_05095 [Bacteroidaceae bacterium]|nr:hypothetical protein [Bacteroidaceae bacterium]
MKRISEGRKMFVTVMATFILFAIIFILFEDYDRTFLSPFEEASDWHLLIFSVIVMCGLGVLLHRYARRMDERISREQAEKQNALRRELTQNIAHELKTPVASIRGYAETLLDNPDLDGATRTRFVERTLTQAVRLTSLLQDISTLNRMDSAPEQIEFAATDIAEIVRTITLEMALTLDKHKAIVVNTLPKSLMLHGNASMLYSVMRNLLDNALIYGGTGVTVRISAHRDEGMWHFTFSDNGPGVAEEHLPRLFERFYRIDKGRSRAAGGTGLGLSIVKNVVLLHGGTITVTNAVPHGLRFDFTLPSSL